MIKSYSLILILLCSIKFTLGQSTRLNRLTGIRNISENWDSTVTITKYQLDSITLKCISMLTDKQIPSLTNSEQTDIIRLANSGLMVALRDTSFFQNTEYNNFLKLLDTTKFIETLVKLSPDWLHSRGMGYYFPKLRVEYYGTPHLRSYFLIKN